MKILHIAPVRRGHLGGISRSVPRLADAQASHTSHTFALLSSISTQLPDVQKAAGFGLQPGFFISSRLERSLPDEWHSPDLVHFHSTYIPAHAWIARELHHRSIPYLITPRGGLMKFALAHKFWKKKLGNVVFFTRYVRNASLLHCLTERESNQASVWHSTRIVIPNLIDLPETIPEKSVAVQRPVQLTYIGRMDIQIKGVDRLLEGFWLAHQQNPSLNAHLNLVGPDADGQQWKLEQVVKRYGLSNHVTFHGPCAPRDISKRLFETDVVCLCSRSEGQPNIILEAMGHAVPCLVTPETNMEECIQSTGSGWCTHGDPESIAKQIQHIISAPNEILSASANARLTAEQTFAAPVVCQQLQNVYEQLVIRQ